MTLGNSSEDGRFCPQSSRNDDFIYYIRFTISTQRKTVKNMNFARIRKFCWAAATGVVALGLLLSLSTLSDGEPAGELSVQTRRTASEQALFSGRAAAEELAPGTVIDLNRATQAELERLDGIGEAKAREILAWRGANGPFRTVEDLTRVDGIGEATLENIRPYITVE